MRWQEDKEPKSGNKFSRTPCTEAKFRCLFGVRMTIPAGIAAVH